MINIVVPIPFYFGKSVIRKKITGDIFNFYRQLSSHNKNINFIIIAVGDKEDKNFCIENGVQFFVEMENPKNPAKQIWKKFNKAFQSIKALDIKFDYAIATGSNDIFSAEYIGTCIELCDLYGCDFVYWRQQFIVNFEKNSVYKWSGYKKEIFIDEDKKIRQFSPICCFMTKELVEKLDYLPWGNDASANDDISFEKNVIEKADKIARISLDKTHRVYNIKSDLDINTFGACISAGFADVIPASDEEKQDWLDFKEKAFS